MNKFPASEFAQSTRPIQDLIIGDGTHNGIGYENYSQLDAVSYDVTNYPDPKHSRLRSLESTLLNKKVALGAAAVIAAATPIALNEVYPAPLNWIAAQARDAGHTMILMSHAVDPSTPPVSPSAAELPQVSDRQVVIGGTAGQNL